MMAFIDLTGTEGTVRAVDSGSTCYSGAYSSGTAQATADNADGSGYSYSESVSGKTRTITTNWCPNHPYFNLNPNTAIAKSTTITVPAYPRLKGTGATQDPLSSADTYTKDLRAQGADVG
jgi:hypothetical protein